MRYLKNILPIICLCISIAFFTGCGGKKITDEIVINELMASNRTGLLSENNKPSDWIELKNTSGDTLNLKGYGLRVVKSQSDSVGKNKKDKEPAEWRFPEVRIPAGECMVVFAEKQKDTDSIKSLTANLKLPKEGGTVQFVNPRGKVLTEVSYGVLNTDQSLSRQPDSTYVATYLQSPGFENTPQGYESAQALMDKQRKGPLLIWEVMAHEKGSNENWVELKNVSDKEVNLSDYSLAKKTGKDQGWKLPSKTLKPGELITFRLAGRKANPYNSQHAKIKLGDGETIVLLKNGKFKDGVNAVLTFPGVSIGRAEGKPGFFYYSTPTRNEENGKEAKRFIAPEPELNLKPGVYPKDKKLSLRLKDGSRKVHYTLDGSAPTSSSQVIKDSIVISKGTTVRMYAEGDSTSLRSKGVTATYLPGVEHDLAVVNITVNNGDLYDYNRGIYAKGPGYSPEWPHKGANFWQKWTRNAQVEFLDGKEGFSTGCGLMIFGGFSRYEDKKSFRLKFRPEYGDAEVDYDFFDNGEPMELEDLVLRAGAQDYNRCMIRDEFFTGLLKPESPAILTQLYRPVALYINAEYFGLYYLREKIDRHFVSRKLNVPSDSITIVMSRYIEEGDGNSYHHLMNYVKSHDLSKKENYDYVRNLVDLEGLIDFKLGEIYSGNSDVGNVRYVRSTAPESDKKWHFVYYDLDASWIGYKPSVEYYLSTGGGAADSGVAIHNILINRLLQNKEFRELFLQRLSHHLTKTFSKENATAYFDMLVEKIRPEMKRNCERWPQLSYEQWEKNIGDFRSKFEKKPQVILDEIRQYLSVTDAENKKYFGHLGY